MVDVDIVIKKCIHCKREFFAEYTLEELCPNCSDAREKGMKVNGKKVKLSSEINERKRKRTKFWIITIGLILLSLLLIAGSLI